MRFEIATGKSSVRRDDTQDSIEARHHKHRWIERAVVIEAAGDDDVG
ncbi:MAG: hypothetical protein SFX73_25555 [Kofleriaceae bacterium]|nr:hypothetical protein [Kofleriaceae bacterium]